MKREEFEHAVRAVGGVLGTREVLVIGSQALHAAIAGELPREAARSVEIDVAALSGDLERAADLIDGTLGEGSMFHSTFGYYAHGVAPTTAVLPAGWQSRLVAFQTPATNGVVARCLEVHDLWISKAIAGREKDIEFCNALTRAEMVNLETLVARLGTVAGLDPRVREAVASRISGSGSSQ